MTMLKYIRLGAVVKSQTENVFWKEPSQVELAHETKILSFN